MDHCFKIIPKGRKDMGMCKGRTGCPSDNAKADSENIVSVVFL